MKRSMCVRLFVCLCSYVYYFWSDTHWINKYHNKMVAANWMNGENMMVFNIIYLLNEFHILTNNDWEWQSWRMAMICFDICDVLSGQYQRTSTVIKYPETKNELAKRRSVVLVHVLWLLTIEIVSWRSWRSRIESLIEVLIQIMTSLISFALKAIGTSLCLNCDFE